MGGSADSPGHDSLAESADSSGRDSLAESADSSGHDSLAESADSSGRDSLAGDGILATLHDALKKRSKGCTLEGRALADLVKSGQAHEAHARVAGHSGTIAEELAGVSFHLAESSGRRGARRLLALVRGEVSRSEPLVPKTAHGPIIAWASFRLWRHGRALALARAALGKQPAPNGPAAEDLPQGARDSGDPPEDLLWTEVLEAIRDLALRQGYLGHAREASRLADRFAALVRPTPVRPTRDRSADARKAEAIEELLTRHREQGIPVSLLRYLARSLGHPEADSAQGATEVARDLSVTKKQLAKARDLSLTLGLPQAVRHRLAEIERKGFSRHSAGLRLILRGSRVLFWVLIAGFLVLGLTLLMHL